MFHFPILKTPPSPGLHLDLSIEASRTYQGLVQDVCAVRGGDDHHALRRKARFRRGVVGCYVFDRNSKGRWLEWKVEGMIFAAKLVMSWKIIGFCSVICVG